MVRLNFFLGAAYFCLCAPVFGATLSVSVGFPSAPQAQGCSKTSTNSVSAVCGAILDNTQGTALASIYKTAENNYRVLGAIQTTQPDSSTTTVKSSLTIQLDEFQNVPVHGVKITQNCSIDCEPIQVLANGNEIGTLWGKDELDVPCQGAPLTITLYAIETSTTPGADYVGLFNLSIAPRQVELEPDKPEP